MDSVKTTFKLSARKVHSVLFKPLPTEKNPITNGFYLMKEQWAALGSPEQITITVSATEGGE